MIEQFEIKERYSQYFAALKKPDHISHIRIIEVLQYYILLVWFYQLDS